MLLRAEEGRLRREEEKQEGEWKLGFVLEGRFGVLKFEMSLKIEEDEDGISSLVSIFGILGIWVLVGLGLGGVFWGKGGIFWRVVGENERMRMLKKKKKKKKKCLLEFV